MSILIVDDNRKYASWTEAVLRAGNYAIEHVENAAEAIAAVNAHPVDYYEAVFSDITMEHPGAGLTMVPKLRKRGYRGVVVLVSTGFDYWIVLMLSKLMLPAFGVDGLVVKRGLRERGEWRIHWLNKRSQVQSVKQQLDHIALVPGWKANP